jgi:hypothetical protein
MDEVREMEDNKLMEIKKYANFCGYTDVDPYEVVRTISPICVEVRAMSTKQIEFPKQFYPGGFVGHFADNRGGQKYEYTSNPDAPVFRIRWSRSNRHWQTASKMRFAMSDNPYKFYDYNF